MSFGLSFFVFCVVAPSVFAIAKCQAYLVAGFVNVSTFGRSRNTEPLGLWAIFRRQNYLWFLPALLSSFFIENGQTYSFPSPEAFLVDLSFVSTSVGICCTFRDVLERRYGPSISRERNARIYAVLLALGVILFVLFMEFS